MSKLAEALIEYHIDQAISGACYDLLGYLTTLPVPIQVGASKDSQDALNAFTHWAAKRGLDIEDEPDIDDWPNTLGMYLGADKSEPFPESVLDEDAFRAIVSKLPRSVRARVSPEDVENFLQLVDDGMAVVRAASISDLPMSAASAILDTVRSLGIL